MFIRSFILLKVAVRVHNATIRNADTEIQENCIQKKKYIYIYARALKISKRSHSSGLIYFFDQIFFIVETVYFHGKLF